MKLKLELLLNNEAFGADRNAETARILRTIADKIERDSPMEPGARYVGLDINGNGVGEAKVMR